MTAVQIIDAPSYHAHVYYIVKRKPEVIKMLEVLEARNVESEIMEKIGSLHDNKVGPHMYPSVQISFLLKHREDLLAWLTLNLPKDFMVMIHPNTGDELTDHVYNAGWLGKRGRIGNLECLHNTKDLDLKVFYDALNEIQKDVPGM
eukprot:TRINITY_DN2662_c0_g1_i1.p1 TRINITY_DN2662_c0_g1~~TRINITY_DN2662_c0_g1_i1.p1  ORF type:complete len:146 (-),score=19.03 TRINITY_DN2662_c0_g1_i1:30-467(-)